MERLPAYGKGSLSLIGTPVRDASILRSLYRIVHLDRSHAWLSPLVMGYTPY